MIVIYYENNLLTSEEFVKRKVKLFVVSLEKRHLFSFCWKLFEIKKCTS